MKAKTLTYIHSLIVLLGIILQTLMISAFYQSYNPIGYGFTQYTDRLIIAIITYLFAIISFGVMTYYTTLSSKIVGEERKRNSLIFLRNFYLYLFLSILILFIGVIYLAIFNISTAIIQFAGIFIYLYPSSLGIATILGFVAIVNLFLFGFNEYIREVSGLVALFSVILVVLGVLLSIWPNNYYGVYSLKEPPDIRVYTNVLLLIYYLLSLFLVAPRLFLRARSLTGIVAFRFKVIAWGYILGLGFFIFYMLDTIYGGGLPYTFWMFLSWGSLIATSVMLYIGLLTPSWLEEKLRKRSS